MYIANKTWKNNTKGFFGKKLGLEILSDNVFFFFKTEISLPPPPIIWQISKSGWFDDNAARLKV